MGNAQEKRHAFKVALEKAKTCIEKAKSAYKEAYSTNHTILADTLKALNTFEEVIEAHSPHLNRVLHEAGDIRGYNAQDLSDAALEQTQMIDLAAANLRTQVEALIPEAKDIDVNKPSYSDEELKTLIQTFWHAEKYPLAAGITADLRPLLNFTHETKNAPSLAGLRQHLAPDVPETDVDSVAIFRFT